MKLSTTTERSLASKKRTLAAKSSVPDANRNCKRKVNSARLDAVSQNQPKSGHKTNAYQPNQREDPTLTSRPLTLKTCDKIKITKHPQTTKNSSQAINPGNKNAFFSRAIAMNSKQQKGSRNCTVISASAKISKGPEEMAATEGLNPIDDYSPRPVNLNQKLKPNFM